MKRATLLVAFAFALAFGRNVPAKAGDPTISLHLNGYCSSIFDFNESVDFFAHIDWQAPLSCCDAVTVEVRYDLICPRSNETVSTDVRQETVDAGSTGITSYGTLVTPDGSDPDDTGPFCVRVTCQGENDQIEITVQEGGAGGCGSTIPEQRVSESVSSPVLVLPIPPFAFPSF